MDSQTSNDLLAEARNPDGSPRFYPFGRHPAADRWREQLHRLNEFASRYPIRPPAHVQEMIDHAEQQIAMVEEGEARAKQSYLRAHAQRIA